MKLLHSSDWHLGKSLFAKSLLEDQATALEELLLILETHRPQALLLAGDLFDRSVPPEDAVEKLDGFLSEAVLKLKIPVAMIPGNHDSSTRVGAHANLLRSSGLHVFANAESIHRPLKIESDIPVSIYGVPYLEPAEWGFYFSENLRTHAEALDRVLAAIQPSVQKDLLSGRRVVLMLHAYVAGGEPTESERPLSIGGSELVPTKPFEIFDYVALGHLHRPQAVTSPRIRYSGSLFPYSLSEAGQNKGAVLVTFDRVKTQDRFELIDFKNSKKLHALRGSLEELLNPSFAEKIPGYRPTDYTIAVLSDSSLPLDAFRNLNALYPGLLHVGRSSDWSRDDATAADLLLRSKRREVSDQELISQFLEAVAVQELAGEDRDWILAALDQFTKMEAENGGPST